MDKASARNAWLIEWAFRISLLGKAVIGLVQVVSGAFLWLAPTDAIRRIVGFLTRNELAEDPSDPLAQAVIAWASAINPQGANFYVVYLLGHGAIHFVVVTSLLLKWRIAYPFSLATLCAFVAYQTWKYLVAHDPALLVLTIIDVAVIAIVILEHRLSRGGASAAMARPDHPA